MAKYVAHLAIRIRGRPELNQTAADCKNDLAVRSGDDIYRCAVECDGGGFAIRLENIDNVLWVYLAAPYGYGHLRLSPKCGEEIFDNNYELLSGLDDKVFRLDAAQGSESISIEEFWSPAMGRHRLY